MKTLQQFLQGKWLGHPLHPILAHVPAGVWPSVVLFDLLSWWNIASSAMARTAFYAIAAGLAVTLLAVPAGLADWSSIKKEKPAWKLGLIHMALNLVVAALFAINLGLRVRSISDQPRVTGTCLLLSVIGTFVLFISAYLGGLMVFDHGIGVARISGKKWRRKALAAGGNLPEAEGQ